jgi:hypothetical protein
MFAYKVVEVSPVDDVTLEKALATWAPQGWELDRVEFVQATGVRRPPMAFMFLRRPATSVASTPDDP